MRIHLLTPTQCSVSVRPSDVNWRANWPCSTLPDRPVWFELDGAGNLVDHNLSEEVEGHEFDAFMLTALQTAAAKRQRTRERRTLLQHYAKVAEAHCA